LNTHPRAPVENAPPAAGAITAGVLGAEKAAAARLEADLHGNWLSEPRPRGGGAQPGCGYAGVPRALDAVAVVRRVFAELDAADDAAARP
jgi:hypothetical protein